MKRHKTKSKEQRTKNREERSAHIRPVLLALCSLLFVLSGCSQQPPKLLPTRDLPAPEDHFVTTDDNWTLHILRYRPHTLSPKRNPVILCHGLSHNNTFWDLHPSVSLAQYLQHAGYDVWSLSLRGAGQSTKPKLAQLKQLFRLNVSVFNPAGLVKRQPALIRWNWTVDDHIQHDVPAAVQYVLKTTGHKKIHWIGHSLGAMIMFAYLGTHDDAPIRSFVAVAPPMLLIRPTNDVYEMLAEQADIARIGNLAAGTNLRALIGVLTGTLSNTAIDHLFMNDANVDPLLLPLYHYACQEDISPGQFDQLLLYLKTGHFRSHDNKTDYTDLVEKITTPTYQLVGQLDNMIAPGHAALIHQQLASKDKQFRIFGTINGHRTNYGHDDIILAKTAKTDVFPHILNWLTHHPNTTPTTQPKRPTKPIFPIFLRR